MTRYVPRVAIDFVRAFTNALNSVLKQSSRFQFESSSRRSMQYMEQTCLTYSSGSLSKCSKDAAHLWDHGLMGHRFMAR